MDYELLDSGMGYKLERFGDYVLERPCGIALWERSLKESVWKKRDAAFSRDSENRWDYQKTFPKTWIITLAGIQLRLQITDFGHLGVFPEHAFFWKWMQDRALLFKRKRGRELSVLNLFAYSGGATLALAQQGASVCHVDSSKGMVDLAKENSTLNHLTKAPIRWIVDDALKFMQREVKRGRRYDAVILDPPSFGRGSKGEVFKIEEDVRTLMDRTRDLLSDQGDFILFSCHTPGFTPQVMHNLMESRFSFKGGKIDSGEMLLFAKKSWSLPSGSYGRWSYD